MNSLYKHILHYIITFLIFRGCGENYQLGHGTTENVSSPKAIEIFIDNPVVDVAVGFQHCVAVAQSREVYFWGSHDPICDDGTVEKIPTVVGKRSGALHVGVAAGPSQVFMPHSL